MNWNVPDLWSFVILALAAWRTWRLLADDVILEPLRRRAFHGRQGLAVFAECPFCLGFWVSVAWWLAWEAWPHWTLVAATPFALSAVVALIAVNPDAD